MKKFRSLLIIVPAICTFWSCSKHEANPGLVSSLANNYLGTLEDRGTGGFTYLNYNSTAYNFHVQVQSIDDSTIQVEFPGNRGSIPPFTASLSLFNNVIILNIPYQSSGNCGLMGENTFNLGDAIFSGIIDPNAKTLEISIMATIGRVPGCPVVFETFQGTKQ